MGLRFASLGSGSRGNATLIDAGGTCVLVDCGFAVRDFVVRCEALGFDPARLDGILVTHEHGDHVRGVGALARRFGIPVWMTPGTRAAVDPGRVDELQLFHSHGGAFRIGAIEVQPVPVPHDAREPTQFVFSHMRQRFGLLTDLGSITPRVVEAFHGVDALLLECNHDPDMLARGPYPPSLQARVGGRFGHLANDQAAELLAAIEQRRLSHLVAGHLSEKNNAPGLARAALESACHHFDGCLSLLEQDRASGWFELPS